MKRMRDYSKWGTMRLIRKAAHHRAVIRRLEGNGHPCGANRAVLAEIEKQIGSRWPT